jgi:uncharacterized protein (DUF2267 family)
MARKLDAFEHAERTAHEWLADVARALYTDDQRFAYRILRTWLHALRDRLTVEGAVAFAAQLPELLRGVYYDGWQPHRVPVKYSADEYIGRFAREACIPAEDVRPFSAKVAGALAGRFSPGQLDERVAQLPVSLRGLVAGSGDSSGTAEGSGADHQPTPQQLLADLSGRVDVLTAAVRVLTTGFAEEPEAGVDKERWSRATRLAAEILSDAPAVSSPTAVR